MSHILDLVHLRRHSDPQPQHRLLVELDDLFMGIEDGTVKENSFSGCIALGQENLPPLNDSQSKEIKEILSSASVTPIQPLNSGLPILSSMFRFIRGLLGSHDTNAHPAENDVASGLQLLDPIDRVNSRFTSISEEGIENKTENREVQQTDVARFFASQGKDYAWVLPYAWDISNRLNAVKISETEGDLAIFFERRRKLNVQRPKATRFEQSVQRYALKVSEFYCDEKGNITDNNSLEVFIRELVTILLERTKAYWPTIPLLAIFDGLVATVMRPLLHEHRTTYYQHEMTGATGVIVSGNTLAETKKLLTTPRWNEDSQELVVSYVEKALKAHVRSLFMDRFSSFNWDYAKSAHFNSASLADAGLLMKDFGGPVHVSEVMELLRSTNQADDLVQHVSNHFRSDDFIDH